MGGSIGPGDAGAPAFRRIRTGFSIGHRTAGLPEGAWEASDDVAGMSQA